MEILYTYSYLDGKEVQKFERSQMLILLAKSVLTAYYGERRSKW